MKNQVTTIYKQMDRFASVTKKMIISGNIARAKKCFRVAEMLLETGNAEVKNAVSNVFVYSVSCFMELHKCNIHNLFPTSLKAEYLKQVNASGI
ncbi:MAG: hypothetical protein JWP12_982 [Bacteroidetes bacterium]|nr:hypothetical protein [Bacteroidota bacterium]